MFWWTLFSVDGRCCASHLWLQQCNISPQHQTLIKGRLSASTSTAFTTSQPQHSTTIAANCDRDQQNLGSGLLQVTTCVRAECPIECRIKSASAQTNVHLDNLCSFVKSYFKYTGLNYVFVCFKIIWLIFQKMFCAFLVLTAAVLWLNT